MAPPAVLSIAGSDSGGGAGIQADLKAFARCGVHGMTAITALTAQNTVGVTAIHPVPPAFIVEQVRAVHEDIGVDAVKIGMLGTEETVGAVREALALLGDVPVVIDPVMVSESGSVLLDEAARRAIVEQLLPLATVITPNLPEARVLAGARAGAGDGGEAGDGGARSGGAGGEARDGGRGGAATDVAAWARGGDTSADVVELARALHALGPRAVVITGGHREELVDTFFDGGQVHSLSGERFPDGAAHGSGCTHSSALAAHLALGLEPLAAARAARVVASEAVRHGLRHIGAGAGPVDALDIASAWRDRTLQGGPVHVT